MQMIFTETPMHVLAAAASIVNGLLLAVVISVVMVVAVSSVIIIAKHWIWPVAVVVVTVVAIHHRRNGRRSRVTIRIARIGTATAVALHSSHCVLCVIMAHGWVGVVATSSSIIGPESIHCG